MRERALATHTLKPGELRRVHVGGQGVSRCSDVRVRNSLCGHVHASTHMPVPVQGRVRAVHRCA
eukprot:4627521-Pleurochrysis_carterae.AAC.2